MQTRWIMISVCFYIQGKFYSNFNLYRNKYLYILSTKGSTPIQIGSVARPDMKFESTTVSHEQLVEKFVSLLDVEHVNQTLHPTGGTEDGLIPPGTLLLFRGDLIHAGPANNHNWARTAVFLECRNKSRVTDLTDVQMHPMQVAIYQYNLDKNEKEFFHRLKHCEDLYGKSNKPKLTDLLHWPIVDTTLKKYNLFVKTNYANIF